MMCDYLNDAQKTHEDTLLSSSQEDPIERIKENPIFWKETNIYQ